MNSEFYKKITILLLILFCVSMLLSNAVLGYFAQNNTFSLDTGVVISTLILALYYIPMTFFIGACANKANMKKISAFMILVRVIGIIVLVMFAIALLKRL